MSKLSLYYYDSCPYCRLVLQEIAFLGVQEKIEKRNILQNPVFRQELIQGGGSSMVPCLRIEDDTGTDWMYESRDIITFLRERFLD